MVKKMQLYFFWEKNKIKFANFILGTFMDVALLPLLFDILLVHTMVPMIFTEAFNL